ncbi:MAG TPA: hypothetical protein VL485_22020 [Ktedonobacteraceae bacterium]|jgi:uncharacterized spore protein YtfJ|nr:hypothetical protein [Ktedonobacteraceae bacterium]
MTDTENNLLNLAEKREGQFAGMMEKIYRAAQPGAVYSEPVTAGNYTVITASEIAAGGGFGSGSGSAGLTTFPKQETSEPQTEPASGGGSGMGGGGGSSGRPVAVIIIGPEGVTVRPVVDVTKIALAGVTIWGTMIMLLGRLRKARKH